MFSALTKVLQKTLTSMGTQLHEYSKCQMIILIIQILGKVMKRMIDEIWSLSMKWIIVFTMKLTRQLPFRLIRRLYYLQ